jgi:signal transduction histidine kinase
MKQQRAGVLSSAFGVGSGGQRSRAHELTRTHVEPATGRSTAAAASLEVMGRMASELAHELNNQLATALNYAAIVQRRLGADHPTAPHLGELRESLQRATALAATLKLVGRRNAGAAELLELDEALLALAPVLRHLVPDCVIELPVEPLGRVRAQRADLERLIVAVVLYTQSKRSGDQRLLLRCEPASLRDQGVRVCCVLDGDALLEGGGALRGRLVEGASLRHVLKRCGARIGHDRTRAWLDFDLA